MTTTRKPLNTNCFDCDTKLTRSNATQDTDFANMVCDDCFDYAGWENHHNDNGHDDLSTDERYTEAADGCRVCADDKPVKREAKAGHTKGVALTHTSHAGHDHPATKAARAACRKAAATAKP